MPEIVYLFTNEAMPGLVKIGMTTDSVSRRIAQLSNGAAGTGVPLPFVCHYAVEVDNARDVESTLHKLFADYRINPKREFFRIDPEKAVIALSLGKFRNVTPSRDDELSEVDPIEVAALRREEEKTEGRRSRINLSAIGVNEGDTLQLTRDSGITVEVVEGNKVKYNGQTMSLSQAAVQALQSLGYKTSSASGSWYWMFDGKILDDLRREYEESSDGSSD